MPDPTWDDVKRRLELRENHPISLSDDPPVLILIDPPNQSLGLSAPGWPAGASPERPARGIRLQAQAEAGLAAVWIEDVALLRPGFDFILSVAHRIIAGETILAAVEAELDAWRQLVARIAGTETIAAIGVLGELVVMRAALESGHDPSCWVGASAGPIDFRFASIECEVKTTTASSHEHMINGEHQLEPSASRRLFLLSLLVSGSESGSGTSVADLFADVVALGMDGAALEADLRRERKVSLADAASRLGYVLRPDPQAWEITPGFPALTSKTIQSALGSESGRIRDVSYRLRLDGLPNSADPEIGLLISRIRL